MNERLLYGKNELQRVVAVEINDAVAEVFQELEDGTITSQILKNRFWILSNDKLHSKQHRLAGEQHFKWGFQCQEETEFRKWKNVWKHRDIYAISNIQEQFMVKDGVTSFKGMKLDDLSVLSFDIESTGLDHDDTSKVLLISNTFRRKGKTIRKLFSYDDYSTDKEFFEAWCAWVRLADPSILVAHNGNAYDLPYLAFCANRAGATLALGRDESDLYFDPWESKFRKAQEEFVYYKKPHCYGRQIIDTYFLAIKYDIGKKYISYGLKQIIKQEGLEKPNRVYYDASQIRHKYKDPTEFAKIKDYCVDDSDESLALFDLMASPFFYLAQNCSKPFQLINESATGSIINNIMVRSYLQDAHSIAKASEAHPFKGAISFGRNGIYRNALKWDVASLYPSIMVEYKVYSKEKDPKGYFLELVETLRNERLKNKKLAKETGEKSYNDLQESQKITINSCYGFLGTQGLNYNMPDGAEFITAKGREILKDAIKWSTGEDYQEDAPEERDEVENE